MGGIWDQDGMEEVRVKRQISQQVNTDRKACRPMGIAGRGQAQRLRRRVVVAKQPGLRKKRKNLALRAEMNTN